MRCLFCKEDSSNSKSIEHIIPESFGNTEHILSEGIVCDKCNNYFSREVEAPILNSNYFAEIRHRNFIESKKGKIPIVYGFYHQGMCEIGFYRDNRTKDSSIFPRHEKDEEKFIKTILANEKGTIISLISEKPESYNMSRFLGKVALEVLASRVIKVESGLDELVDKPELDELRNFVRRGNSQKKSWRFHEREIYPEGEIFYEEGYGNYEILHEYTLLYTEEHNLFFVIALFGVEYAIDMVQPEINEYKNWLLKNQNKSPLYLEK